MINTREDRIRRIKDCGQYMVDNAEKILGDEKYIRELYLTVNFWEQSEAPYISINKDIIPDSYIEKYLKDGEENN
jgi:hypothetical protein